MTTRVAVVGAGHAAVEHVRAFAAVPDTEVVGIASRTRSRADAIAAEHGVPFVADDVLELATRTDADVVVIAVPELSTRAVAEVALAVHPWTILLEKPAGYHLADAEQLLAAVAATDRRVYVGLNRRFLGSTRAVAAELADHDGPRFIRVQDQQDLAVAAQYKPPEVVRHYMYANSIHTIDYLRRFGRGEVTAVEHVTGWEPQAPGLVLAAVHFASGDVGLYEAVWHAPGPWAVAVTVPGHRWEMRPLEQATTQAADERPLPIPVDPWDEAFKPGFRAQAEAVVRAARGEPSDAVPLADAHETMALIHRLYPRP